jgi:branched-chain amino acid transport system substrate-binding protein
MLRTRVLSGATLVAIVLSMAGCTNEPPPRRPASGGEVKIGVLAPTSGDSRAAGIQAQRGADLAAALVNGEQGQTPLIGTGGLTGVGGAKLTIVKEDTQGKPEVAAAAAAKLVGEDKVVGLVGAFDTEVTKVASQRTESLRVPFVNGDSSADFLTERGLNWFFRTGPTDRMYGEAFFSALGRMPGGARRVAAVFSNDERGNVIADLTEELAREGGFSMTDDDKISFAIKGDAAAAVAAVQRVRDRRPDAVFVIASTPANAIALTKAFGQARYVPKGIFAFGPGFVAADAYGAAGADANGLFAPTAWSREIAARNPVAKPVMDMYEEQFGQPMTQEAAGSFTAVLVLAEAINRAGSTDPERIRAALLNLDVPGREMIMPWSGVRFATAPHQNTAAAGVVEQRIDDQFRVVFPDELQRDPRAAVWPLSRIRGGGT